MDKALKPCPFCGGAAELRHHENSVGAVDDWNRRVK